MSIEHIRYLEELAANAWPAEVIQIVGGWRLRFTHNVSRRVNSVWPNEDNGRHTLTEKLAIVEAFYGRFQIPIRYQICPAAQPDHLDAVLAERGYLFDAKTAVCTAEIQHILNRPLPTFPITIHTKFDPLWFDFFCETSRASQSTAVTRRGILQRIGPYAAYASIKLNDKVVGIGLGVYERGYIGIFNMLTHPDYRRQGIATAILHHLARWGRAQGATYSYLQVMTNNPETVRLYQHLGYVPLYHYHYREKG